MNWNDQNTAGIAWNQVCESMRKMWSVYHNMPNGDTKEQMHTCIIDITEKFVRMSGAIGE
jgi:hypothetical protein